MNKTVLVTGGAKGIGRQIVIDFAKLGYNVCINYNTSEMQAKQLVKELSNYNIITYKCDIKDRVKVDNMVDYVITNFGGIDILVNNAGIAQYKLFTDLTSDDMENMVNTSIIGTFNVTQSVLKKSMIKKNSGRIINISSIWGMVGASCEVAYSTVKAGIIGFTKSLAKELSMSNITVNSVAPGVIETDMIKGFNNDEITEIKNEIPQNRIGTVKDVSNCVLFLASDTSSYITGQVISPNGGIVM